MILKVRFIFLRDAFMRKILKFFFCVILCLVPVLDVFSQGQPVNTSRWLDFASYKKEIAKVYRESIFSSIKTLDFVNFDFDVYEIGKGTESITAKRTIYPFSINKYETTYKLWYSVRTAAESMLGYYFENPGQEGSMGRRAKAPTENENHPVTTVTWYDVVVWCNAFSELCGYEPCYSYNDEILRDSSMTYEIDLCECDFSANGFRLPTEAEWEYAARYKVSENEPTLTLSNVESGAAWSFLYTSETQEVGSCPLENLSENACVNGIDGANFSGIYDMSGNVLEYCFDWYGDYTEEIEGQQNVGNPMGSERVSRGGSFSEYTPFLNSGDRYSYDPNEAYGFMGFRIVKSM